MTQELQFDAVPRRSRFPAVPSTPCLPLVEELTPLPDPWEVARRLAHLPHLLFLDSAASGPALGRYSFVAADPFDWLISERGKGRPFATLAERLARYPSEPLAGLPPFQGGAAGLLSYDLCHDLERLPRPRYNEFAFADMAIGFYDWVIAFDHGEQRAWLISTGFPEVSPNRRRRRADDRLRAVQRWLRATPPPLQAFSQPRLDLGRMCRQYPLTGVAGVTSNFDRPGYLAAVRRIIEYLHAGDCFQVNLAQRLLAPVTLPPLELHYRLRQCNPAPFAAFFAVDDDCAVVSASPERFLRVHQREVETRPIKGTRPRGATSAEDASQRADLLASAKDWAENVMIVDLLRNDLGRVCRYGSVCVPALCHLETHPTVHHLVSEVRGVLGEGCGPVDLLRAAFPGGSVTGAPKIRAMEIIAELEPTARGPYCGSLGYLGFDGSMDTNILIRTFTVGRGWVQFPVGGGIVADSVPEREYEETLHKAAGLLRALE
jgi:para-aminobenzoate synthetase component 1